MQVQRVVVRGLELNNRRCEKVQRVEPSRAVQHEPRVMTAPYGVAGEVESKLGSYPS